MSYFVYILQSEKTSKYYVGSSDDPDKRLIQHNNSRSKSTKHGIPWKLMYNEQFDTRSEALKTFQFTPKIAK